MGSPVERAWQEQQAAAARLLEQWAELAAAGSAGAGMQNQLQAFTRGFTDYAAVALRSFHDLVTNQRELADHMARWAELQHELADNVAAWAAQQRQYADALDKLLAPFLPSSELPGMQATDRDDS